MIKFQGSPTNWWRRFLFLLGQEFSELHRSYQVSDIVFASRKDYALRLPCNHRGKSAGVSVFGSMSSVVFAKHFCACLKCPGDVFLITFIVTGGPGNITHSQHPTGLCMPQGEPHKRSVFLSLKRFRILLDQEWDMSGRHALYSPLRPMEYTPDVLEAVWSLGILLNILL